MFWLQGGRVTPFLFRVGGRRKTSPALITTSTPKPSSRPTKITRRKYQPQAIKPLESQESTTSTTRADSRYKFVSRKPFFRSTTQKVDLQEAEDQAKESSNQQSLEEDFDENDTTELGDIAIALHNIQQAPVRTKIQTTTIKAPKQRPKPTRTATRSRIRYSTTATPLPPTTTKFIIQKNPQAFEKINPSISNTFHDIGEYGYYNDGQTSIFEQIPEHSKVLLHSNGLIECLDQGNFPHPVSCKKFISCAKMENGKVLGWEYTCPKNLSFDPIGGMCNWSAGLGCNE